MYIIINIFMGKMHFDGAAATEPQRRDRSSGSRYHDVGWGGAGSRNILLL